MNKEEKIAKIMREFKRHTLHKGKTNEIVTDKKQAIAIALSQADKLKRK